MTNRLTRIALCIATALMAFACGGNTDPFKSSITGRNGEVLVVVNDDVKADTAGRYIQAMFSETYLGLPADEPIFDIQTVPHGYFDKMMHSFRNLVIVEISDTLQADTVKYFDDVWAKQQALVSVTAKSKAALLPLLQRHHLRILSYFTRAERNRLIAFNASTKHHALSREVGDQWGIDITIPNSFDRCTPPDRNAMSWVGLSPDKSDSQIGLFVYDFPYIGEGTLSKVYLLNKRDSLLQKNIEGPDHSFMCTEIRFGLDDIIYKSGKQNGLDVAELRGLWRMNGCAMGGPFLLRAMHDTINNRVVVADAYVYYPSKERKRNLIRQLESIMYSIDIKQNKE